MKKRLTLAVAVLGLAPGPGAAEVVTDIATDGSLGAEVEIMGDPNMDLTFEIDESLGTRPGGGGNLFHSFERFDVGTGDSVYFVANQPTVNIFSRVTGGQESLVDGTLGTRGAGAAGANLFLFNPYGVAFLENARLDVAGSFSASTADTAIFEDGVAWPTDEAVSGFLSVQPFAAYGFSGDHAPASVRVDQSANATPGQPRLPLMLPAGETLTFAAGDVRLVGRGVGQLETIQIPGGTIQLAAVHGPAEVPADVSAFDVDGVDPQDLGSIRLTNTAVLNPSGTSGGRVVIRGGDLVISAEGDFAGQNRLSLANFDFDAPAQVADIQLGGSFELLDGSRIESTTVFDAAGGDIAIRAGDIRVADGSVIATSNFFGNGRVGDIRLEAGEITVADGGLVVTATGTAGEGGDVRLEASAGIVVENTGIVGTRTAGTGSGGDVDLVADSVRIAGTNTGVTAETSGSGATGNVTVLADRIEVQDGAEIRTGTSTVDPSSGPGGDIALGSSDQPASLIHLDGAGSSVAANAGSGPGGSIAFHADRLVLTGGATATVSALGSAAAGDILFRGGSLRIDGTNETGQPSSLLAQSVSGASGDAGRIDIRARRSVGITNGGQISVASRSFGSGRTGDITIDTAVLNVSNSPLAIQATSFNRDAGNITIDARQQVVVQDGTITTFSSDASGGNIEIRGGELILLRRNSGPPEQALVTAEVAPNQPERGGTVTLAATNIAVDRAGVRASAPGGVGGSIDIQAEGFFVSGGDVREAKPGFFVSGGTVFETEAGALAATGAYFDVSGAFETGNFAVRSPETSLVPEIASLSEDFLDVSQLLYSQCTTRDMPMGSLVVRGRDRAPTPPGERLQLLYEGGR